MGVVYRAVRDDDAFQKTVALKLVRGRDGSGRRRAAPGRGAPDPGPAPAPEHRDASSTAARPTTGSPTSSWSTWRARPITEYCDGARPGHARAAQAVPRGLRRRPLRAPEPRRPSRPQAREHPGRPRTGAPKLLDFGIAKLLAAGVDPDVAPTATMLPMMTPEYASPEQVRGEAVTTGERRLLAGRGALRAADRAGGRTTCRADSLEEIVRAVCESGARRRRARWRPRRRRLRRHQRPPGELRGDLDTIVLKALRKEPSRRYLSAQELSEDIAAPPRRPAGPGARRHARLPGGEVRAPAPGGGGGGGSWSRRACVGGIAATTRQARIAEANRSARRAALRRRAEARQLVPLRVPRRDPGPARRDARSRAGGAPRRSSTWTAWPRRPRRTRRCSSSWRRPTRRWATSRELSERRTSARPRRPTAATRGPSSYARPSRPRGRRPSRHSAPSRCRARDWPACAWPRATGTAPRSCSNRCAPCTSPWPRSAPTTSWPRSTPPADR